MVPNIKSKVFIKNKCHNSTIDCEVANSDDNELI